MYEDERSEEIKQEGTQTGNEESGSGTEELKTSGENAGVMVNATEQATVSTPPRYVDNTANRNYYSSGGTGFSGYAGNPYRGTGYGSAGSNYSGAYSGSTGSTYGNSSSGSAGGSYANTGSGYTASGSSYNSASGAYNTSSGAGSYSSTSGYGTTDGYGATGGYHGGTYGSTAYGTGSNYNNNNTNIKKTKPKKEKKGKTGIALAIVAVLLVGVLIGGGVSYTYLNSRIDSVQAEVSSQKNNNTATLNKSEHVELSKRDDEDGVKNAVVENPIPENVTGDNMSVSQIVSNNLSSVVAITNYGVTEIRTMWGNFTQDSKSAGSGVIISQTEDELLILTNYHVVKDSNTLSVVFSWEEDEENIDDADIITAVVKDYDEARDIAVIAIKTDDLSDETMERITIAAIGDSDALLLGDQVVAIGNALGYGQSVTTGVVSALNRKIGSADENGNIDNNAYIQTDAAINLGNSGGALFNMQGELVGINSAKIGGSEVDAVGFAIPISDVIDEVEVMMNQETRETVSLDERGWLGISMVDVTDDISLTYNLPVGIYISSVAPGSGAEAAGIKKEDVITGINGKSISTGAELKQYISKYRAGETVTLTVNVKTAVGYEEQEIEVTLGENPELQTN